MKVRKLICVVSLAILGAVLPLVGSHHPANFSKPALRADGGQPPPPPPWPKQVERGPLLLADGGQPPPPFPPKPTSAALIG